MRDKMLRTFLKSLEWRAIALVITNIFFILTTHEFWTAAGLALLLQVILFAGYLIWHFLRIELALPLFPGIRRIKTPEAASDSIPG